MPAYRPAVSTDAEMSRKARVASKRRLGVRRARLEALDRKHAEREVQDAMRNSPFDFLISASPMDLPYARSFT